MRAVAACLMVAACATASSPPPQRVAGCWIGASSEASTVTMRWLHDAERPGVLVGHLLEYDGESGQPRSQRFTLEPAADGWRMCAHWQPEPLCRRVAEGEGGTLEGGRVFIDAHDERLRISMATGGLEEVIFEGRRDGCD